MKSLPSLANFFDGWFHDDTIRVEEVRAWREAALADGWTSRPTYDHEAEDRAFTMEHPEGFIVTGLSRPADPDDPKWPSLKSEAHLHLWRKESNGIGSVMIDDAYGMAAVRALLAQPGVH